MSNKVQINCNRNQNKRQSDLKYLRKCLSINRLKIEELEEQIKELNRIPAIIDNYYERMAEDYISIFPNYVQNNQILDRSQIQISVDDPYHPNYSEYIHRQNLIENLQIEIKNYQFWIRIITSEISKYIC